MAVKILKSSLTFLKDIEKNNNREWFKANKATYDARRANILDFVDEVLLKMKELDHIETPSAKKAMFRIYRDVRFSKDKTPYNKHWSAAFSRATAARRGSYYIRIENGGKSGIGGGFYGPNSDDMRLIRSHIAKEPERFRAVIEDENFVKYFGVLQGEQLKTSPRDYSIDHPAIDLLRYKQFYAFRTFSDAEVTAPDFFDKTIDTMKAISPFFDYMSEILTTNLNGESLLEEF